MRILPMKCGKAAEQNLWNKALGIIFLSAVTRTFDKNLTIENVKKDFVETAKYLLKNDDKTQEEVATVLACKLRKYLG